MAARDLVAERQALLMDWWSIRLFSEHSRYYHIVMLLLPEQAEGDLLLQYGDSQTGCIES